MTEAERRMWFLLRDRRFDAMKFRRQVPIGRYVADFACFEAKVVIELDGSRHASSSTDNARDADLRTRGFEVVRVWNNELFLEPDAVMRAVQMAVERQGGER
jgi:very-short-patch-repair endonuclease